MSGKMEAVKSWSWRLIVTKDRDAKRLRKSWNRPGKLDDNFVIFCTTVTRRRLAKFVSLSLMENSCPRWKTSRHVTMVLRCHAQFSRAIPWLAQPFCSSVFIFIMSLHQSGFCLTAFLMRFEKLCNRIWFKKWGLNRKSNHLAITTHAQIFARVF